jgi:hypothetical protein
MAARAVCNRKRLRSPGRRVGNQPTCWRCGLLRMIRRPASLCNGPTDISIIAGYAHERDHDRLLLKGASFRLVLLPSRHFEPERLTLGRASRTYESGRASRACADGLQPKPRAPWRAGGRIRA